MQKPFFGRKKTFQKVKKYKIGASFFISKFKYKDFSHCRLFYEL